MAEKRGNCVCGTKGCDLVAEVREMKGKVKGAVGKLYLFCPECGVVRSSGKTLQNYIASNMIVEVEVNEESVQVDFIPHVVETEIKKDWW